MFDKYFEVILANTQESREIHYNIRYQVYCEELGYEDVTKFPKKQEIDKWDPQNDQDQRTLLFLVRLKHTEQWIGAMRIVHHNGDKIPLEDFSSLDHDIEGSAIEISRLCLVKEIRKPYLQNSYGINEANISNSSIVANEEAEGVKKFYSNPQVKSTIIWGLFNAALQYGKATHINKCYLLASKALVRVVRRQGFAVEQVGSTCEHRGKRSPYRLNVNEVQDNPLWGTFNRGYQVYSELLQEEKAA